MLRILILLIIFFDEGNAVIHFFYGEEESRALSKCVNRTTVKLSSYSIN